MPLPVDINFPEGGFRRLRTADELRAFIDDEWTAWNWLSSSNQLQNYNGYLNNLTSIWNDFSNTFSEVRSWLNGGNLESAIQELANYQSRTVLPYSKSPAGQLVLSARESIGNSAGIGALATLRGLRIDGSDSGQVRGLLLAHEFMQGTGRAARRSVQDSMHALFAQLTRQQSRAEDLADTLDQKIEALDTRRKNQFKATLLTADRARKRFASDIELNVSELRERVNEAVDRISSVQSTFEEHMRLKAPVTYWRDKAGKHKTNGWIAGMVGVSYAIIILYIGWDSGVSYVLDLVDKAVEKTHLWQTGYVVLSIVIFLLTILFWIGRLISRTYVSQTHLAIDAEERATMVETYLALTKENKISDAERILVLTSLFRASSDGLVKDDGAPDTGPANLLSRVAASK